MWHATASGCQEKRRDKADSTFRVVGITAIDIVDPRTPLCNQRPRLRDGEDEVRIEAVKPHLILDWKGFKHDAEDTIVNLQKYACS